MTPGNRRPYRNRLKGPDMDKRAFKDALERSWSRQTSTKWTPGTPATGQCSVTALVVQDWYGGDIAKTLVEGAWHFYNVVDGERIDFTADQFLAPVQYADVESNRLEAFGDTSEEQYRTLAESLRKRLPEDPSHPSEESYSEFSIQQGRRSRTPGCCLLSLPLQSVVVKCR